MKLKGTVIDGEFITGIINYDNVTLKGQFNLGLLHGNKILPFITDQTNDIDELDDFKKK